MQNFTVFFLAVLALASGVYSLPAAEITSDISDTSITPDTSNLPETFTMPEVSIDSGIPLYQLPASSMHLLSESGILNCTAHPAACASLVPIDTISSSAVVAYKTVCETSSGSPYTFQVNTLADYLQNKIGDMCCQYRDNRRCQNMYFIQGVPGAATDMCGAYGQCAPCYSVSELLRSISRLCTKSARAGGYVNVYGRFIVNVYVRW
ncbi:hypothetical protein EDC01DRAFT_783713 [Geopyxis carbonaria]|nr:hypothetical protein EDC01DRAFT_783713 [Geopyxis carbonaria]